MTKGFSVKQILLFLVPIIVLIFVFTFSYRPKVVAGTDSLNQAVNYEKILIIDGDTLSGIVSKYTEKNSNLTEKQYKEDIIILNSLESDYLYAGDYLFLPVYK